jgi:hypothetical protein
VVAQVPARTARDHGYYQVIEPCVQAVAVQEQTQENTQRDSSSPEGQQRALYRRVRNMDGRWRCQGLFDQDGRSQMREQRAYKLVCHWEQGPIPPTWTIDHACCKKESLDHLEAATHGENLRRRRARERGKLSIGHAGMVPPVRQCAGTAEPPASKQEATLHAPTERTGVSSAHVSSSLGRTT